MELVGAVIVGVKMTTKFLINFVVVVVVVDVSKVVRRTTLVKEIFLVVV